MKTNFMPVFAASLMLACACFLGSCSNDAADFVETATTEPTLTEDETLAVPDLTEAVEALASTRAALNSVNFAPLNDAINAFEDDANLRPSLKEMIVSLLDKFNFLRPSEKEIYLPFKFRDPSGAFTLAAELMLNHYFNVTEDGTSFHRDMHNHHVVAAVRKGEDTYTLKFTKIEDGSVSNHLISFDVYNFLTLLKNDERIFTIGLERDLDDVKLRDILKGNYSHPVYAYAIYNNLDVLIEYNARPSHSTTKCTIAVNDEDLALISASRQTSISKQGVVTNGKLSLDLKDGLVTLNANCDDMGETLKLVPVLYAQEKSGKGMTEENCIALANRWNQLISITLSMSGADFAGFVLDYRPMEDSELFKPTPVLMLDELESEHGLTLSEFEDLFGISLKDLIASSAE